MTNQEPAPNNMSLTCANHKLCKQERYWTKNDFLNAVSDRERIRIMLCNSCYASFLKGPITPWLSLKNKIAEDIKLSNPI